MTEDSTIKFIKNVLLSGNNVRGKEAEANLRWGLQKYLKEQLRIARVVSSSDLIVIELSDEELKIVTEKELELMEKEALEFDGFEGWYVKGRLVKLT